MKTALPVKSEDTGVLTFDIIVSEDFVLTELAGVWTYYASRTEY